MYTAENEIEMALAGRYTNDENGPISRRAVTLTGVGVRARPAERRRIARLLSGKRDLVSRLRSRAGTARPEAAELVPLSCLGVGHLPSANPVEVGSRARGGSRGIPMSHRPCQALAARIRQTPPGCAHRPRLMCRSHEWPLSAAGLGLDPPWAPAGRAEGTLA